MLKDKDSKKTFLIGVVLLLAALVVIVLVNQPSRREPQVATVDGTPTEHINFIDESTTVPTPGYTPIVIDIDSDDLELEYDYSDLETQEPNDVDFSVLGPFLKQMEERGDDLSYELIYVESPSNIEVESTGGKEVVEKEASDGSKIYTVITSQRLNTLFSQEHYFVQVNLAPDLRKCPDNLHERVCEIIPYANEQISIGVMLSPYVTDAEREEAILHLQEESSWHSAYRESAGERADGGMFLDINPHKVPLLAEKDYVINVYYYEERPEQPKG
jgi:hypothetical protein